MRDGAGMFCVGFTYALIAYGYFTVSMPKLTEPCLLVHVGQWRSSHASRRGHKALVHLQCLSRAWAAVPLTIDVNKPRTCVLISLDNHPLICHC